MATAPFKLIVPRSATIRVALAPVHNALLSLSLLNAAEPLPDSAPWVAETTRTMTPAERQAHRLIFQGLGEIIMPGDEPDFPAYLKQLAAQSPVAMRDRLLHRLLGPWRPRDIDAEAARLLEDAGMFVDRVARIYPHDPVDTALQEEVHRLLNNSPALHDLVVSNLSRWWESWLAAEWRKHVPRLAAHSRELATRIGTTGNTAEALRLALGADVPEAISAQLHGIENLVLAPSPHAGPVATRFGSAGTLWVFVRVRPEDRPGHHGPVKRSEVVGPLAALADDTRLRILELLAQHGELLAQELISRLDLSQSSISRHLKHLAGTGFVLERRGDGANKSYRLNYPTVEWTSRALTQLLSTAQPAAPADVRAEYPELRRYLDAAGRIVVWPAKRGEQVKLFVYLASRFEEGREYTEREVNDLLKHWSEARDHVTLRRDLFDEYLLHRTRDGARYWRDSGEDTE